MLIPKKQKYRKQMRGRNKGKASKGYTIAFGDYALKAVGRGYLTSRQIESARKAITSTTKRSGKLWIRLFPDKPISKKPLGVRMGAGKGAVDHYASPVVPGKIVFELGGIDEDLAKEAFRKAGHKLPFKTKFIKRED